MASTLGWPVHFWRRLSLARFKGLHFTEEADRSLRQQLPLCLTAKPRLRWLWHSLCCLCAVLPDNVITLEYPINLDVLEHIPFH